ncbi:MAG: acyl-CoA thioesterase [Planctomycetales bacterium]|nr:acyl-CoA thioesterase [Planctomycetales bacterium]
MIHEKLAGHHAIVTLPVLWGDMDAFGHVNNVRHIRWFESARVAFLEQANLRDMMLAVKLGPILASVACHYRKQIKYPDTIHVGSVVQKLGRTSMTLHHRIISQTHDDIAAEGESVVVIFDYQTQRPVRIPEEVRLAMEAMQASSD